MTQEKAKNNGKAGSRISLFLRIAVFLLLLSGFRFLAPYLVFFPSRHLLWTPAVLGYEYEDVFMTTPDGITLHGWWIPALDARATLLFLHGNAGNISYRLHSIRNFHNLGLSVFILSYRGYGQSEGRPSFYGINIDAMTAWQWLTVEKEKKIPADEIVVFGRSLGGAVAVELMRSAAPSALILESTFSSIADMAFPIPAFLTRFLTRGAWDSARTAASVTVPTLFIHSADDEIIPIRFGRRVYEALAGERTFFEIHGGHDTGFLESSEIYLAALDKFLTRHFGPLKVTNE